MWLDTQTQPLSPPERTSFGSQVLRCFNVANAVACETIVTMYFFKGSQDITRVTEGRLHSGVCLNMCLMCIRPGLNPQPSNCQKKVSNNINTVQAQTQFMCICVTYKVARNMHSNILEQVFCSILLLFCDNRVELLSLYVLHKCPATESCSPACNYFFIISKITPHFMVYHFVYLQVYK